MIIFYSQRYSILSNIIIISDVALFLFYLCSIFNICTITDFLQFCYYLIIAQSIFENKHSHSLYLKIEKFHCIIMAISFMFHQVLSKIEEDMSSKHSMYVLMKKEALQFAYAAKNSWEDIFNLYQIPDWIKKTDSYHLKVTLKPNERWMVLQVF